MGQVEKNKLQLIPLHPNPRSCNMLKRAGVYPPKHGQLSSKKMDEVRAYHLRNDTFGTPPHCLDQQLLVILPSGRSPFSERTDNSNNDHLDLKNRNWRQRSVYKATNTICVCLPVRHFPPKICTIPTRGRCQSVLDLYSDHNENDPPVPFKSTVIMEVREFSLLSCHKRTLISQWWLWISRGHIMIKGQTPSGYS